MEAATTWKCSTNLPNPRSHSCASSHVLVFPPNTTSLFLLLKLCHLVAGLFCDAMNSFACLFDVFYHIFTGESTVKLTNSTIFDSSLDPENHKHASYKDERVQTQLLHYFSKSDNKSNHHQKRPEIRTERPVHEQNLTDKNGWI